MSAINLWNVPGVYLFFMHSSAFLVFLLHLSPTILKSGRGSKFSLNAYFSNRADLLIYFLQLSTCWNLHTFPAVFRVHVMVQRISLSPFTVVRECRKVSSECRMCVLMVCYQLIYSIKWIYDFYLRSSTSFKPIVLNYVTNTNLDYFLFIWHLSIYFLSHP